MSDKQEMFIIYNPKGKPLYSLKSADPEWLLDAFARSRVRTWTSLVDEGYTIGTVERQLR